jgi:Mitochondrial carrier protein
VIGSMPSVAIYFGVYSYGKGVLIPYLDRNFGPSSSSKRKAGSVCHLSSRMVMILAVTSAAAVGNTVASFSRVPYEVVKQHLQTGLYANTWEALTRMSATEGWRAFFPQGGIAIQMVRDIPYAMVTLLSYELLKEALLPLKASKQCPDGMVDATTGALAGGIGSYVTNPFDVIKTRMQTNPDLYQGSMALCATDLWKEGNIWAFTRGSVPRLMHKIPANACFFLFYEFFRKALLVQDDMTVSKSRS